MRIFGTQFKRLHYPNLPFPKSTFPNANKTITNNFDSSMDFIVTGKITHGSFAYI